MRKTFISLVILINFTTLSSPAYAGVYANELSKCIIEKTTEKDKLNLIKWMFTALSQHPEVKSYANFPDEEKDVNNKNMAGMITKIFTDICVSEIKKAIKYEGQYAVMSSFKIFGEVAAKELFSHPAVAEGMKGFEKYFDEEKLKEVFNSPK